MDSKTGYESDYEGDDHPEAGSMERTLREVPSANALVRSKTQRHSWITQSEATMSKTTLEDQAEFEMRDEKGQEPPVYPSGWSLFLISISLILGVMCMGLDNSILATATPKITAEFNSLGDIGWYGSVYLLTASCFQLMFGKLYAEFNVKWVFLGAMGLFEIGSVICAAAPSSMALILGRAVAGLGGAGILTGALLIMVLSVPLHERPKFTGIVGGFSSLSQIIAPFLGGLFTDKLSWRWCFWINMPLGGVTIIVVLFFLHFPPQPATPRKSTWEFAQKFDLVGTLFLFPAIICLLLVLQWGGTTYSWSNWRIILLFCLFSVAILAWAFVQWRLGDNATVPVRLVRMRSMAAVLLLAFCNAGYLFVVIQYVPIWFQVVYNASAYQSGINFLVASGSMALMSIFAGYITTFIGYYIPQMYIASAFAITASSMIYSFRADTSTGYWVGALLLVGIGAGIGQQQPMMVPQTILNNADIPIGTSILVFVQSVSGSVFLSVANNLLNDGLQATLEATLPQVDPQVVLSAGAGNLVATMQKIYPKYVGGIVAAYGLALQRVFLVAILLAAIGVLGIAFMEWKPLKKADTATKKRNSMALEMGVV